MFEMEEKKENDVKAKLADYRKRVAGAGEGDESAVKKWNKFIALFERQLAAITKTRESAKATYDKEDTNKKRDAKLE